ncbi:hypothetical protein, partial [Vacuolonema iberomarrocanum]|uniref:hypothetical protein n=1 Tax=Vacuolonema iberomarrocanum TaxID=3454632 RepID=UPI003F6DEC9D
SQGDNTVSIGGWGNVPPKPYKPTICLRILLALENEDPTLNKYLQRAQTIVGFYGYLTGFDMNTGQDQCMPAVIKRDRSSIALSRYCSE